jgi:hypothetical protein
MSKPSVWNSARSSSVAEGARDDEAWPGPRASGRAVPALAAKGSHGLLVRDGSALANISWA